MKTAMLLDEKMQVEWRPVFADGIIPLADAQPITNWEQGAYAVDMNALSDEQIDNAAAIIARRAQVEPETVRKDLYGGTPIVFAETALRITPATEG